MGYGFAVELRRDSTGSRFEPHLWRFSISFPAWGSALEPRESRRERGVPLRKGSMKMRKTRTLLLTLIAVGLLAGAAAGGTPQNPRKVMALLDGTQNFGTTKRAINFYDVTDVGTTSSTDPDIFNQSPMFSVFVGFDDSMSQNYEDIDSFTLNPANGTVYAVAYDSGPNGVPDGAGDTQGDLDVYRIDYQEILNDYVTNGVAAGTMYGPTVAPDGGANPDHPDHFGTTRHIANAITKVGEVGRTQGSSFFDRDVEFIDPQTLALVDNEQDSSDTTAQDHELRILERVSTSAGAATIDTTDLGSIEGGYNRQTAESWEADRAALLNMDFDNDGNPIGFSEPEDIALGQKDGVTGVFVGETDGGGDDISFFELSNIAAPAQDALATKSTFESLGTSRSVDEDPEADPTTNDGDHDGIKVDVDGNLVIVESGYFDTVIGGEQGIGGNPAGEPTVLRLNIDAYQSGNLDLSTDTWDDLNEQDGLGPVGSDRSGDNTDAPTQIEGPLGSLDNAFDSGTASGLSIDDDTYVTDGRFTALDKGENLLYVFDIDGGGLPDVVADTYVIDLDTGDIVYEEKNSANHFLIEHGIRWMLRGDITDDGHITADDIDELFATDASSDTLVNEWHDLTGDGTVDSSDLDELVQEILGTYYGDTDLDGDVDLGDLGMMLGGYGSTSGMGWADGDLDGDAQIGLSDLGKLLGSYGSTGSVGAGAPAPTPEPTTMLLLGLGGAALIRRRRRV